MPRVLALLLPLAVLALGGRAILALGADDLRFNLAGNTVAKVPRREGPRAYIEDQLAGDPRVVVLGDSTAGTDIDRKVLARTLRLAPEAIANFSMPGSTGAHWYAILDNLVLRRERPPDVVLVVGVIHSLLATDPGTEGVRASLEALLDGDDPVLATKAGLSGIPLVERARASRVRLRGRITDTTRALPVGWLWAPDGEASLPWAVRRVDGAVRTLFSRRDLELELIRTISPTPFEVRELSGDPSVPVAATLVPDLVAAAQARGVRIVIVRPPVSPIAPPGSRDEVSPGVEREVARLVTAAGGVFVDAARWPLGLGVYDDVMHLDADGARRFSQIVGEQLVELGVLSGAPRSRAAGRDLLGEATFAAPPPPLTLAAPEPGSLRTTVWTVPQAEEVLDAWLGLRGDVPRDCLPLRSVAGGRPIPRRPCPELLASRSEGACFDGSKWIVRAADPPAVEVDPARACGPLRWLFPGDEVAVDGLAVEGIGLAAAGDAPPRLVLATGDREWTWTADGRAEEIALPASGSLRIRNASDEHLVLLGLAEGAAPSEPVEEAAPSGRVWVRPAEPAPRLFAPR